MIVRYCCPTSIDEAVAILNGDESGKVSRISAKSTLEVRALTSDRSSVHHSSDITIPGRLGKFAAGVMRKMAESMGERFIAAIRESIEHGRS